jgi:hypothetical protein
VGWHAAIENCIQNVLHCFVYLLLHISSTAIYNKSSIESDFRSVLMLLIQSNIGHAYTIDCMLHLLQLDDASISALLNMANIRQILLQRIVDIDEQHHYKLEDTILDFKLLNGLYNVNPSILHQDLSVILSMSGTKQFDEKYLLVSTLIITNYHRKTNNTALKQSCCVFMGYVCRNVKKRK